MAGEKYIKRPIRKTLLFVAIIIIVCAVIYGIGFDFGYGKGSGTGTEDKGPQASGLSQPSSPGPSVESLPSPTEEFKYVITVSEKKIYYQDKEYTLDSLKEALLRDYTGGYVYKLHDDHAIKSTYDSVKALLSELDIEYIEK